MTNLPDLITATGAGEILGCSPRTVKRNAADGELEYEQKLPGPRGAYLFDRAKIEALAAARVAEKASKQAEQTQVPA